VSSNARPSRRWVRRVVGAVVVVVVLAVGVPFVYIHFIEGKAPAKLALTTGAGGATVLLDGTWAIGPGSVAGYRVGEVLLGQNNTAVGRTSSITGSVVISGTTVTSAALTVDLTTVKSGARSSRPRSRRAARCSRPGRDSGRSPSPARRCRRSPCERDGSLG